MGIEKPKMKCANMRKNQFDILNCINRKSKERKKDNFSVILRKMPGLILTMATSSILLTACGKEKVTLSIWTTQDDLICTQEAVDEFIKENEKEADFDIKIYAEDVGGAKKMFLNDSSDIADIFILADDQITDLMNKDVLLPVSVDADQIIEDCGGIDATCIEIVYEDGTLYAYPLSTSNGYFLYYNKAYFSSEDVKTLDRILQVAGNARKNFSMDWSSGWYLYSFFGGAGMSLSISEDGQGTICDFNRTDGTYTGLQVTEAMFSIAQNEAFLNIGNSDVVSSVKRGDVIAFVSGVWDEDDIKQFWGENLGCEKLPTYTIGEDQVQMASFAGFTYFGVNKETSEPEWAQKLAKDLIDYDNQIKRFEMTNICPANINAAESEKVKESIALNALWKQNEFATCQRVGESYWAPMSVFGTYIAAGNPDHVDLQELLNQTVSVMTK